MSGDWTDHERGPARAVPPEDGVGWLARELGWQRLRTVVAVELAMLVEEHLPAAGELMAAVAADIVARWVAARPDGADGQGLFGPDGFVASYVRAVEYDRDGSPHRVFCRPGNVVGGHLVAGCGYWRRVWMHHAGWLLRVSAPLPAVDELVMAAPVGERGRVRRLCEELEVERLRTQAAAVVAPLVWQALDEDRDRVAVVAAGVVAAWLARGPEDPQDLTGPCGFVDAYFARVSYVRAGEVDEEFRPEFLPERGPGGEVDVAAYERAVWTHHAAELAGAV